MNLPIALMLKGSCIASKRTKIGGSRKRLIYEHPTIWAELVLVKSKSNLRGLVKRSWP